MQTNQPNPAQQAMTARLLLATEMERDYSVTAERLRDESWPDDRFPLSTQAAIRALAARELTAAQGVSTSALRAMAEDVAKLRDNHVRWDAFGNACVDYFLSQPTEPQGAVVVTDDMVTAAIGAWFEHSAFSREVRDHIPDHVRRMRAALEAALPVAVGAGEDELRAGINHLIDELCNESGAAEFDGNREREKALDWVTDELRELIAAMTPATPSPTNSPEISINSVASNEDDHPRWQLVRNQATEVTPATPAGKGDA